MASFMTGSRWLAIACIAAGVILLRETYTFQGGFLADSIIMGPMTFPRYLAFGWLGASVLYFLFPGNASGAEDTTRSRRALLTATILIAAYVALFYYLGFLVSTILFLMAFFFAEGYRNAKLAVLIASVTSFLFWFVFEKILQVPMPEGILSLFLK
jgi:putative tricarboxylic transport membrane protein